MTDKDKHFLAGIVIYLLAWPTGFPPFLAVLVIACAKEAYDAATGRGVPEIEDIAFTCLGGLVGHAMRGEI